MNHTLPSLRSQLALSVRLLWPFARAIGSRASTIGACTVAGITPGDFADPDARWPHSTILTLLDSVVAELGAEPIGLLAADEIEGGDLGVLGHAARCCATLGEALACTARNFRLMNEAAELILTTEGDVAALTYRNLDGLNDPLPIVDFVFASIVRLMGRHTSIDASRIEVCFAHAAPPYRAEYDRHFRGLLLFECESNRVRMPRSSLALPMKLAEPVLAEAFNYRAEALLARTREGRVASAVARLVLQQLATGQVTMPWIARQQGVSAQTLRRRLDAEGTTFRDVVDRVRKGAARRGIEDPNLGVGELAFLLGFSSVSSFHRAFKRWYGETPTDFRLRVRMARAHGG